MMYYTYSHFNFPIMPPVWYTAIGFNYSSIVGSDPAGYDLQSHRYNVLVRWMAIEDPATDALNWIRCVGSRALGGVLIRN